MPIAVVTGASGGVGRELIAMLIDAHWDVFAQFRTQAGEAGATWWQANLADPAEGHLRTLEEAGLPDKVDALIHCAGVCPIGTTEELRADVWRDSFDVNVVAPAELTRVLLPRLRAAGGHVIYVNSGAGLNSNPRWGAYSAAKHAARAWCNVLRGEEPKLRVTSIYPGRIATAMQEKLTGELGEEYTPERYLTAETVARQIALALDTPPDAQLEDVMIRPR